MPYKDKAKRNEVIKAYRARNCETILTYQKQWRAKNRDKIQAYREKTWKYLKKYNLTKEEYQKLLENQNGKCKICKIEAEMLKAKLHVDHDHKTGKVRGLLCKMCNLGIGNFRDNPSLLNEAIIYLNQC